MGAGTSVANGPICCATEGGGLICSNQTQDDAIEFDNPAFDEEQGVAGAYSEVPDPCGMNALTVNSVWEDPSTAAQLSMAPPSWAHPQQAAHHMWSNGQPVPTHNHAEHLQQALPQQLPSQAPGQPQRMVSAASPQRMVSAPPQRMVSASPQRMVSAASPQRMVSASTPTVAVAGQGALPSAQQGMSARGLSPIQQRRCVSPRRPGSPRRVVSPRRLSPRRSLSPRAIRRELSPRRGPAGGPFGRPFDPRSNLQNPNGLPQGGQFLSDVTPRVPAQGWGGASGPLGRVSCPEVNLGEKVASPRGKTPRGRWPGAEQDEVTYMNMPMVLVVD